MDISTDHASILIGDDWLDFLLRCRAVLGTESGASLMDIDGSLRPRVDAYMTANPGATFEEVERACFEGVDGNLDLRVLSPRHLEACATRTCQVLIRGEYSGVLEADRHYLALEPDYRNLDDVVSLLRSPDHCRQVAEQAYEDVVASGKWSYREFVRGTLDEVVAARPAQQPQRQAQRQVQSGRLGRAIARRDDPVWRRRLALRWWCARRLSAVTGVLGKQKRVPAGSIANIPMRISHRLRRWPRADSQHHG